MPRVYISVLFLVLLPLRALAQEAYTLTLVDIAGGTFVQGEPESEYDGPPGTWDAAEVSITLSDFRMSETEVTNAQYVAFLNAAEAEGLVEVAIETAMGPDSGSNLVYGTSSAPSEYTGVAIVNLSGTRVMKDHDDGDGDGNSFTGVIEPENPLNISYLGYNASEAIGSRFYVKDPRNADDFDWQALTNYYNYASTQGQFDTSVELNDYSTWSELQDYPNNLPTQLEVANWPASFIRWYGAKAFALYHSYDLPTEAEWEVAAQGRANFTYATASGSVASDGTSAIWNWAHEEPATGHVLDAKWGSPNPYGLYNLAGNVWEWTEDWYDASFYADGASDPVNTTDSGKKVRRGGSWNYHLSTLESAGRASDEQFKGNDHFGFRVISRSASSGTNTPKDELPESLGLSVFPNPVQQTATFSFSSAPERQTLEVFDVLGRSVYRRDLPPSSIGSDQLTLDMSTLRSGLYLFRLGNRTGNFLVQR